MNCVLIVEFDLGYVSVGRSLDEYVYVLFDYVGICCCEWVLLYIGLVLVCC